MAIEKYRSHHLTLKSRTMKKDITEIFQNFRECARHIWNTYFRTLDDGSHKFINVERELYESMVLEQIYGDSDYKADEGE
jgi:hypothetical protein